MLTATEKFTGKANLYDDYRPPYPARIIEAISESLPRDARIVEIGAGTGKLAFPLIDRGYDITCVEPNKDMREVLICKGRQNPDLNLRVINGRAHITNCPNRSADVILLGNVCHWLDRYNSELDIHRREFSRILAPGGRVVAVSSLLSVGNTWLRPLLSAKKNLDGTFDVDQFFAPLRDPLKHSSHFIDTSPESIALANKQVGALLMRTDRSVVSMGLEHFSGLLAAMSFYDKRLASLVRDIYAHHANEVGNVDVEFYSTFLSGSLKMPAREQEAQKTGRKRLHDARQKARV